MDRIRTKRLIYSLLGIALLFGGLGLRLVWLQLGLGHHRSSAVYMDAVRQRSDGIVVDIGRGQFVDRNGIPLTGEIVQALAAFPAFGMPRGTPQEVREVADALQVSPQALNRWLRGVKAPAAAVWNGAGDSEDSGSVPLGLTERQASAIRSAGLFGVEVLPYRNRYLRTQRSIHAIGYISQDPARLTRLYGNRRRAGDGAGGGLNKTDPIGGAGLERSLDRLLRGAGKTVVYQVTDAAKRPLAGLGMRTRAPDNPHYPLQVATTLDAGIQREAEQAMIEAGVKAGAAVVLDAEDGDILAMVSLPQFDPNHIGAKGTDERNHAITAYAPGSVFKTVTLAAALESGIADPHTLFHCTGTYGRYGLKCWKHDGHGELTLQEAFAESCNVAFATLAEKMDPAWIQITAERLGLGRRIGWSAEAFADGKPLRLLEEEEAGAIFASRQAAYRDGGVRTGTGIGQRDVRVTPLQAANMVVTLLHGGRVAAPRFVSEIRYADGGTLAKLPRQTAMSRYGHIRPQTAGAVLEAMRAVVTEGTARRALAGAGWPLAGKSGTAELAGKWQGRNDHWFVGFGPANAAPRYAIAVLIQAQPGGLRNRAAAVFGDMMARMLKLDRSHPGSSGAAPAGRR